MILEKNVTLIALFAGLIAVLGLVPAIPLAFGISITGQSLGVMLCGTVLGAKRGGLAVLLFVVLVAIGLPLLAGGRGGLGVFQGPSAGFIIGFPFAAFVTGLVTEKFRSGNLALVAGAASIIGCVVVLYAFGIVGFSIIAEKTLVEATLVMGAFIPGDVIKAIIAGALTAALYKARPASVLSRA